MTENFNSSLLNRFVLLNAAAKNANDSGRFPTEVERKEALIGLMTELRKFDHDIDTSDLFSPNELIDDVHTTSLKYLLVSYIFGEFLMNTSFGYDLRPSQLKEALIVFTKFVDRLDLLFLVTPEQRKLLTGSTLDPATNRALKIAEFKREKALLPKLSAFHEAWAKQANKIVALQTGESVDAKVGTYAQQIVDHHDENEEGETEVNEEERDVMLDILSYCVDKIIGFKRSIKQELEILEHHKEQIQLKELEQRHGKADSRAGTNPSGRPSKAGGGLPIVHEDDGGVNLDSKSNDKYVPATTEIGPQLPKYNPNPTVSTSGVSTGGLHVHRLASSEDTKSPIPEHMKKFLSKPTPTAQNNKSSGPSGGNGALLAPGMVKEHKSHCPMHPHQIALQDKGISRQELMSDEERLAKPWFNAVAGTSCDCDSYEDVTMLPDYVMSTRTRGGRGKLVKLCQIHKTGVDVCGCDQAKDVSQRDRINETVSLRTDRTRVFRDRNPYLMELDDWAKMKIEAGDLPGIKDRQLADRMQSEEERHRLRIEAGESDEDEQLLTRAQVEDIEDAEQMKKRAWDDWTDDNQKGAGNKKYGR